MLFCCAEQLNQEKLAHITAKDKIKKLKIIKKNNPDTQEKKIPCPQSGKIKLREAMRLDSEKKKHVYDRCHVSCTFVTSQPGHVTNTYVVLPMIQRVVTSLVRKAELECGVFLRNQDPTTISRICRAVSIGSITSQGHAVPVSLFTIPQARVCEPYLSRCENDWATIRFILQLLCNQRSYKKKISSVNRDIGSESNSDDSDEFSPTPSGMGSNGSEEGEDGEEDE